MEGPKNLAPVPLCPLLEKNVGETDQKFEKSSGFFSKQRGDYDVDAFSMAEYMQTVSSFFFSSIHEILASFLFVINKATAATVANIQGT